LHCVPVSAKRAALEIIFDSVEAIIEN